MHTAPPPQEHAGKPPPKLLQYIEFRIISCYICLPEPFWMISDTTQNQFWDFSEFSKNLNFYDLLTLFGTSCRFFKKSYILNINQAILLIIMHSWDSLKLSGKKQCIKTYLICFCDPIVSIAAGPRGPWTPQTASVCKAPGKPSTWFPSEGPVEWENNLIQSWELKKKLNFWIFQKLMQKIRNISCFTFYGSLAWKPGWRFTGRLTYRSSLGGPRGVRASGYPCTCKEKDCKYFSVHA